MLLLRWNPDCHFWSSTLPLDEVFKDIQLSDCDRIIGMKIFCSCDGLFLIGIWFEPYVVQPSILVIWNPSTKESIAIPHSKCPLQMDDDDDGYYDGPDDVGSAYGFAYDSINDDYKVFRIDMYAGYEILSLKNGSWRIMDETSAVGTANWMLAGWECLAFVHGAFHWIGILSRKFCIVSFNISYEMFGEIQLPEILCSQIHIESVVDVDVGVSLLGGMLGVYYKNDKAFDLWLMKNYSAKDSWMKLFTISSIGVYSIIPKYMFSNYKVLLCFCFDGETKRYVYRTISGGPSGRIWPLDYVDDGAATIEWDDFVYTESLISPKLGH
ncbi:hypothetical protein CQW23_05631 [Capsicum baccatum]|uniref:F-box associated beta-propeller type 1 domain-containing protein n=1 Tax=Capsicum baccatum TaxID=33114 RepID=A0A2G2XI34_CAPBA|nr:hypothetical protein CQW23_05631 [Capsicum baccatum]